MAEIGKVLATTIVKAELFDSGITKLDMFKGDKFKKFIKSTMNFEEKIEDENKDVLAVLERVGERITEAGPCSTPVAPSSAKVT